MSLEQVDPELYELCRLEKNRQRVSLELIASENFASRAVLQALSSSFHNKYSEGQVGARYYGGNEIVDAMESLCQKRALEVFHLDPSVWGVCVQSLSGSPANFAVYTALVGPNGRIMGLYLPDGGHLSHGFQSPSGKKVSATSLFFESMPYRVNKETGLIDYDALESSAKIFLPNLIIAGVSAYSRKLDYRKFREIADSVSSLLMADMAHVSGLVAAGLHPSPFDYCDVVTTTTHKTLRGPRAALIFYRRLPVAPLNSNGNGVDVSVKTSNIQYKDLGRNICEAVFPGLQGGPHVNSIAAIAVALKEASQPAFYDYQKSVLSNMRVLCNRLQSFGYTIVTGGSDTHMCLVDLRPIKIEASCAEALFEMIGIAINKNTVPGDVNAVKPGGIRLGSAALTSRGFKEADFEEVASIIHTGIQLTKEIHNLAGSSLASFKKLLQKNKEMNQRVLKLKKEVESFAASFPMPGFDDF